MLKLRCSGGDCIAKIAMLLPGITGGVPSDGCSQLGVERSLVSGVTELVKSDIVGLDAENPLKREILVPCCIAGRSDN